MNPWQWYMIGLSGAVALSSFVVTASGALHPIWNLLIPVAIYLAYRRYRKQSIGTFAATVLGLGGFGIGAAAIVQLGLDGLVVAGAQTILILVLARLSSAETVDHDQQVLALTLLAVLTGTILNLGLSFGAVLILYAIFASWALLGRQMVRGLDNEGKRSMETIHLPTRHMVGVAFLALGLILGSSVLFVLFPRIGLNSFGINSGRAMGLPEAVSLDGGRLGLEADDIVAARILGLPPTVGSSGLYLRFEDYPLLTSSGFRTEPLSSYPAESEILRRRSTGEPFNYTVQLAAHGSIQLPALGLVRRARVLEGGTPNPSRVLRILGLSRVGLPIVNRLVTGAIRYNVNGTLSNPSQRSRAENFSEIPDDLRPFLKLPKGTRELAELMTLASPRRDVGDSATQLVEYFEAMFRSEFKYSLDIPVLPQDSLYEFLLRERQGHCEFFAAGLTLLLRINGIPARVVGGFAGGAWDESTSTLIFQGRHAHAWVEWWSPDAGWQLADGTPAGSEGVEVLSGFGLLRERLQRFWDDNVVDFGWQEQVEIARSASRQSKDLREAWKLSIADLNWRYALLALGGAAGMLLVAFVLRRWWLRRSWGLLEELEFSSGLNANPGETLKCYVDRVISLRALGPELGGELRRLETQYESFTFGGHPVWSDEEAQAWRQLCKELKRQRS